MKWLKSVFEDRMTAEYRRELFNNNIEVDIRRSRIMLVLLLLLESVFLLFTCIDDFKDIYSDYLNNYRTMYCIMIIMSILFLVLSYVLNKRSDEVRFKSLLNLGTVIILFMLIWGAALSVMDISRGINSSVYLYVVFSISIFVFMNPIKSLVVYGLSFTLYCLMIGNFVEDSTLAFSSSINGASFVITAWIISLIQYQSRKRQFLSDKIILEKNEQLSKMADIDPLTNTFNRRSLDRLLKKLYSDSSNSGKEISVMMIDIDYFKDINDCYGHIRGDEVLVIISDVVKKAVSSFDGKVCRYGGDEFCVLFLGIGELELKELTQKIKQLIFDLQIENRYAEPSKVVTISVGCSIAQPNVQGELWDLIKKADIELYEEKSKRLNRRRDDFHIN